MEYNIDRNLALKKAYPANPIQKEGCLFCPDCGRTLPLQRKHKFCPECGKKILYEGVALDLPKWDPMTNRPRVCFDHDNCMNNFNKYLVKIYNERTGLNIKPSELKEWDLSRYLGDLGMQIFKEEGFFEKIPPKKNSIKTLKELINSKKYDVYIITACGSTHELEEKYNWFDKFLPEFNKDRIIGCKEKHIIHADVLVDDNLDNLHKCAPYMKCVTFDMPHNRDCDLYPRIKDLTEIIPMLESWFY